MPSWDKREREHCGQRRDDFSEEKIWNGFIAVECHPAF
jgi:hypothetical protein